MHSIRIAERVAVESDYDAPIRVATMTMPNFFVLGAMKAGTTSTYSYLRQHPDVFMPEMKEPRFFGLSNSQWNDPDRFGGGMTDPAEYRALFAAAGGVPARGEATPHYLCDPTAIDGIREQVPDARLIIVLRQPVDRAYSNYLMKCRQGWETLGFEEALAAEPQRIRDGWGFSWRYARLSHYREQLEHCHRRFDPRLVKVVLFDDLVRDPVSFTQELFRFLGVDDSFRPDTALPVNAAFLVRHPRVHRWIVNRSRIRTFLKRFLPAKTARALWEVAAGVDRKWNSTPPPLLEPAVRARLTREWNGEIGRLAGYIERDLSHWCET